MSPIVICHTVDFPPAELFAIAADIESYPDFLPNCVATRIVRRTNDVLLVDNVFRWGPLPIKFRTRAKFEAPHRIDIQSIDALLIDLSLSWRFQAHGEGTKLTFEMSLKLPSKSLSKLMMPTLQHQAEETQRAFLKRAQQLRDTA